MNPTYSVYVVRFVNIIDNVEISGVSYDTGSQRGVGRSQWLGRYQRRRVVSADAGVILVPPEEPADVFMPGVAY
jgi:hypothetical protein